MLGFLDCLYCLCDCLRRRGRFQTRTWTLVHPCVAFSCVESMALCFWLAEMVAHQCTRPNRRIGVQLLVPQYRLLPSHLQHGIHVAHLLGSCFPFGQWQSATDLPDFLLLRPRGDFTRSALARNEHERNGGLLWRMATMENNVRLHYRCRTCASHPG